MELGRDIAVGGTLCTVGDGAAQYAFTDTFDGRRLGAMTSYGSWSAVIYHYWYAFLARRLPPTAYMQKAALDCFVVTPGFEIPALMTWTGMLGRGQTLDDALVQLRRDFPTALAVAVSVETNYWSNDVASMAWGLTRRRERRWTSPCGAPPQLSCSATCPYASRCPTCTASARAGILLCRISRSTVSDGVEVDGVEPPRHRADAVSGGVVASTTACWGRE